MGGWWIQGQPPMFRPLCQSVSSWAWGSPSPALGCLCWRPSLVWLTGLCSHPLRLGPSSHRPGSPWSLCWPDWGSCCAGTRGRGGSWPSPFLSHPLTGLHDLHQRILGAGQLFLATLGSVACLPLRPGLLGRARPSPNGSSQSQLKSPRREQGRPLLPSLYSPGLGVGRLWSRGRLPPSSPCLPGPLTAEEVVDNGVGSAVGIHQPVGEGEAGVDGFSVAGLAEHPEHPRTRARTVRNGVGVRVCDPVYVGRESPSLSKRQESQGSERESESAKVTQLTSGYRVQEFPLPLLSHQVARSRAFRSEVLSREFAQGGCRDRDQGSSAQSPGSDPLGPVTHFLTHPHGNVTSQASKTSSIVQLGRCRKWSDMLEVTGSDPGSGHAQAHIGIVS